MTTVQVQTQVSLSELLRGVQQLDAPALEQFTDEVMRLRAKRRAPSLPGGEAKLLQQINQRLLEATQARFDELKAKRPAETSPPAATPPNF